MTRLVSRMLLVVVASVSLAFAQVGGSLQDQLNAQLAAQGIDPATATAEQQDAALDAVFESALAAQLGGDISGATDAEIAAAVAAIVASSPTLSDNTVGALAGAATRVRPSAAAAIAGQAATARPSAAGAVTYGVSTAAVAGIAGPSLMQTVLGDIAVAVANAVYSPGDDTAVVIEIAAAASMAFSQRRGKVEYPGNVFVALGALTGLGMFGVLNQTRTALGGSALFDRAVFAVNNAGLGNEFFGGDDEIIEENPAQDASPS